MKTLSSETLWHGQKAWVLENESIRTVVVPGVGAKIVSLFDKRTNGEWLADSGTRPLNKIPYAASFVDQDMSGWDEMFPTITACKYPVPGVHHDISLPDHGEVWALEWHKLSSAPETLKFSVEGKVLPYRLTRTLAFSAPSTLQMQYELENMNTDPMPFVWAAHPQFSCGESAEIRLSKLVQNVRNVLPTDWGWGEIGQEYAWPQTLTLNGQQVRIDHTRSPSHKSARKFFVDSETTASWAGLLRHSTKDWLRLDWDPNRVPYLAVWVDEGTFKQNETVVAIEPLTGFNDSLALAWQQQQVAVIESHETITWTLQVRLGTGAQAFPDSD